MTEHSTLRHAREYPHPLAGVPQRAGVVLCSPFGPTPADLAPKAPQGDEADTPTPDDKDAPA